jgi:RNA polymerase sigma-70 factor (ECF subfamily)
LPNGPQTPEAWLEGRASLLPAEAEREGGPAPSDDDLVRAAAGGEERAFEVLLSRHEATVLRVLRLLGVNAADREDVAQEVFLRVFRYLGAFRPGRPFSGWIYRITVNASHDYHNRLGRRRRDEAEWREDLAETAAQSGSPGERELDLRRRLLAGLEERERAVFVLCELEGLETREVARALGITRITVRRHLGRARRSLQVELGSAAPPKKTSDD